MRKLLLIACPLACLPAYAQPVIDETDLWMHDYVVVTMSMRGDWGVGVSPSINDAIKTAIDNAEK